MAPNGRRGATHRVSVATHDDEPDSALEEPLDVAVRIEAGIRQQIDRHVVRFGGVGKHVRFTTGSCPSLG